MMKVFFKVIFAALALVFFAYLFPKSPDFPDPPPDAVQSQEEGDSEALYERRAYFTDYTREEVLAHYQNQFDFPVYRLNYPPEEAQILIRDQTRSTFLEEIVRPFRESFFVNGFEPKDPKDDVWYKGIDYRQKITVRYIPTSTPVRLGVALLAMPAAWLVIVGWGETFKMIKKLLGK